MQTATESHHLAHSTSRNMPASASHAPIAATPPLLSDHLLQGRKTIEINHNGSVYRLQATKLGKLILTK